MVGSNLDMQVVFRQMAFLLAPQDPRNMTMTVVALFIPLPSFFVIYELEALRRQVATRCGARCLIVSDGYRRNDKPWRLLTEGKRIEDRVYSPSMQQIITRSLNRCQGKEDGNRWLLRSPLRLIGTGNWMHRGHELFEIGLQISKLEALAGGTVTNSPGLDPCPSLLPLRQLSCASYHRW